MKEESNYPKIRVSDFFLRSHMLKSYRILQKQLKLWKASPVVLDCVSCSLWVARRYCHSVDPSYVSSFGRETSISEQKFAESNSISLYLQCVAWRPELFSFKELGILLDKHYYEVLSIPEEVFEAVMDKFPDLKEELKRSHHFLGRVEYFSFFSCVLNFIRRDISQLLRKQKSSKEQLDAILKYRREQEQLLDTPKLVKNRASGANAAWRCSLLLPGYNIEASPCKNLKTGKYELYAKAVCKIFADFVKNIEKDFYSSQTRRDDVVFDAYLRSFIAEREPTQTDSDSIALLKRRLENVIQKQYPDCSLEMFGSAVTGLWKPGSDVDFVILPRMDSQEKKCKAVKYLRTLTGVLRKTEMFSVLFIGSAKVPIIKVVDYCSGLKGDISWGSTFGIVNSNLIRQYLDMNEQLKKFVRLVKEWASSRQLVGASRHYPSSYCWVLICIWFLQRVQKILPVIFVPEDMPKRNQLDWIRDGSSKNEANSISCKLTLTQLLERFFRYFAYEIPSDAVIFVSQQSRLIARTNKEKKWKVEDPLEIERDLMCHVNYSQFQVILYEFLRAHRIISTENKISKLFDAPKGENIRRRMSDCFDCLLETELNNKTTFN